MNKYVKIRNQINPFFKVHETKRKHYSRKTKENIREGNCEKNWNEFYSMWRKAAKAKCDELSNNYKCGVSEIEEYEKYPKALWNKN